jgi:hypothetical protein
MSTFDDAFSSADKTSFDVMGSDDGIVILSEGSSQKPIRVIEQPNSNKNVFLQGGRFDTSPNVFEVFSADLISNGVTSDTGDGFICQRKGQEFRCIGIVWEGGTASITLEPNVNRRD